MPDSIPTTDPYVDDPAFALHQGGKLAIASRVADRRTVPTCRWPTRPGVGRVSQAIADEPALVWATPAAATPSPSSPTAPPCSASATSARRRPCR